MQLSPFVTLMYKIIDLFRQFTLLSFTFKYQSSNKMENKFMFSILLTFYLATITQCYQVQLQDPFPMTNNLTSISHIAKVPSGWLAAFQNKQMRSYTANLSLLSAWNTLQIMGKIQYSSFSLINFTLSNGSRLNVFHQMITTTSKDCQTLRGILWPSFTPISMISLSQKILAQTSIPIPTSQRPITMSIIISNQSIKQYYKQSVKTLYNFTNQFGLGVFGVSANLWKTSTTYQTDCINISFIFYIGISNNLTKQIIVLAQMEYDYSSLEFALVASVVTAKNILTTDSMITKMIIINDFLVLQSNSTGSLYLYNCLQQVQGSISANFPKNQILDIINNGNQFYLLSSTSFSKISLSTSTNYLSFTAIINSLTANNYRFVKGSLFDIFYIVAASKIYKAGLCIDDNKLFNGTDCDSYNCQDNNCDDCPITRQACSRCKSGMKKSDYFTCSSATPPSITITYPFNQTYISNTTSSNSSLANNQSNINSTNSNTNQTSDINSSNTSNNSLYKKLQQFDNFLQDIPIFSTVERLLQLFISVPAARCTLKPIFYLFGTFDDLYLYSFHDRKYGNAIKALFLHINTLQNAKWTLISKIDGINYEPSTFIKALTQSKSVYLTFNYIQSDLNNGSQGLLKNCSYFFLFSLPVTIAFFSIFRIIYILFHKRISILQNFSQWTLIGFLILTFFDGNIQQFAFFTGAQLKKLLFFNVGDKVNNTIIIFFSFSLILVSIGGYLIGYLIYKQQNNKLIENNKNIFDGIVLLLLQNGLRNLLLGFIHSFCRLFDNYFTLLGLLLCIQILFFTIFIKYVTPHNFIKVTKMWMYLLLTFMRILIIVTLFFDYKAINIQIMQELQQNLIFCMIIVYISSVIIFLAEAIQKIILSIIKISKGNQSKAKSQSKKKSAVSMLVKIENNINNRPIQTAGIQTAINQKQEIQTQNINVKRIYFQNRFYKNIKTFKTIFINYGKKQDFKKSLSLK